MATATYSGTGITCAGWTAGDGENDRTCNQDENSVHLDGPDGEAHPGHNGTPVPNLNITHVSKPAVTRSLPADAATNQNQLARPRGQR